MIRRQGALISELALLHLKIVNLPEREKNMLVEDLADVESTTLTIQQRIETIHRIYFTLPQAVTVAE